MPRINNFYFDEAAFRQKPEAEQLWIACRENEFHVATELLRKGADPNHTDGCWGKSSLHCAAENRNTAVLSFLLTKGADPTIKLKNGTNVLHVCVRQELMQACRDISERAPQLACKKNWEQLTPLDIARQMAEAEGATQANREIVFVLEDAAQRATRYRRKHPNKGKEKKKFAPGFAALQGKV